MLADVRFSLAKRGRFNLTPSLRVIPREYRHKCYIAETRFFGLHFTRGIWRYIFNQFYVIGPKSTEFGEIAHTTRPLLRSRSFKVTDFGTNRKLISDCLLVINTNLPSILHHFQVMADYLSLSIWEYLTQTPSLRVTPCEYLDKPLQKLEWLSYLTLKTARSYLHSSGQNTGMWRTDRRTDRIPPWAMRTRCKTTAKGIKYPVCNYQSDSKLVELAFSAAGRRVWNQLPTDLKTITDTRVLTANLNLFLKFSSAYP